MENLHNPIELEEGVYWLGVHRNSRLEVNVYLRVFTGNKKTANMIIDPGGPEISDILLERIKRITGDARKIHMAFLNHQDPDVVTNTMYLQKLNPNMSVICTENVWRLVHFLKLNPSRFQPIDHFKNSRGRLSTGHVLQFVPTPYCHFRGACMLYDEKSRILFSGDFLGGLTFTPQLFATSENWDGIRIFHQTYMPVQRAVRIAVDNIRKLYPPPKMIAPQHGTIIRENLIDEFLEKLYELPVGLDLSHPSAIDKAMYVEAINDILETIAQKAGQELVDNVKKQFAVDSSFPSLIQFDQHGKLTDIRDDLAGDIMASFKMLINALSKDQSEETKDMIRNAVLLSDWNLPLFEAVLQEQTTESELLLDDNDDE